MIAHEGVGGLVYSLLKDASNSSLLGYISHQGPLSSLKDLTSTTIAGVYVAAHECIHQSG